MISFVGGRTSQGNIVWAIPHLVWISKSNSLAWHTFTLAGCELGWWLLVKIECWTHVPLAIDIESIIPAPIIVVRPLNRALLAVCLNRLHISHGIVCSVLRVHGDAIVSSDQFCARHRILIQYAGGVFISTARLGAASLLVCAAVFRVFYFRHSVYLIRGFSLII